MSDIATEVRQEVLEAHSEGFQTGLEIAAERVDAAEKTAQQVIDSVLMTALGQRVDALSLEIQGINSTCQESLATAHSLVASLQMEIQTLRHQLTELEMTMLILMEAEETEEPLTQETLPEAKPETVETPETEKEEKSEAPTSGKRRMFR